MANNAFLKVRNLDKLNEKLKTLPEKVGKKVVVGAMMEAAEVIRQEAIRLAPSKSGLLKRSISKGYATARGREKPGEFHVRVGLARLKKSGYLDSSKSKTVQKMKVFHIGGKTFVTAKGWRPGPHVYGKWQEFDTKFRKGLHFVERAATNKAQETVDVLTRALDQRIQEAVR